VTRRCAIALSLILVTCATMSVSAETIIPSAYRRVADAHGIPAELFYAVALTESGKRIDAIDSVRPWPWTLNVHGDGRFYPSRAIAASAFRRALAAGRTSVDVGLMQVNWRYHRAALGHVDRALDPYANLNVAAAILTVCYHRRGDWWAAIGCYHAPNAPGRAEHYSRRVRTIWRGLLVRR